MPTLTFAALARGSHETGYSATFQDLSHITVASPEMAELFSTAREAVRGELQRLSDAGQAWPKATPVEQIALQPGTFPLLVDVAVDDPAVRVNISIGERLLARLDLAAEVAGMSRSGFIADAVRSALNDRPGNRVADEFDAISRTLREDWSQLGRKISDNLGPDSALTRNLADFDNKVSEVIRRTAESVAAAMARRGEAEDRVRPPEAAAAEHREPPAT